MKIKILLFIIFSLQISNVYSENDQSAWVCSEKLDMIFYGSTQNREGVYLLRGNDGVVLSFDYDAVDSIIVIPIKFKNAVKKQCKRKGLIYGKRFHLTFFTPFDGKKISAIIRKQMPVFFEDGIRDYMLIVRKKENGRQTSYFKNFTFIEDPTQW